MPFFKRSQNLTILHFWSDGHFTNTNSCRVKRGKGQYSSFQKKFHTYYT